MNADDPVVPPTPAGCTCVPGPGAQWSNAGLRLVHHEPCKLLRWVQDGVNLGAITFDQGSDMLGRIAKE